MARMAVPWQSLGIQAVPKIELPKNWSVTVVLKTHKLQHLNFAKHAASLTLVRSKSHPLSFSAIKGLPSVQDRGAPLGHQGGDCGAHWEGGGAGSGLVSAFGGTQCHCVPANAGNGHCLCFNFPNGPCNFHFDVLAVFRGPAWGAVFLLH